MLLPKSSHLFNLISTQQILPSFETQNSDEILVLHTYITLCIMALVWGSSQILQLFKKLLTDKNRVDVSSAFWPGQREFSPKVESWNVQSKFRPLVADIWANIHNAASTN